MQSKKIQENTKMYVDEKTYVKILDYIASKITEELHNYGDMSSKCIFIKDNDKHFFTFYLIDENQNMNLDIDVIKYTAIPYGSTASEYFNIMHNRAITNKTRNPGIKRLFSKTIDEYLIEIDMQLNDNVE